MRNRGRDIDQDVEQAIVTLFAEGLKKGERPLAAFIGRELRKMDHLSGRGPETRTLQRIVRGMLDTLESQPEHIQALDKPFEWHRLEEYGLPWEAGAYLLQMSCFIQDFEAKLFQALQISPSEVQTKVGPTVRQARWWWRVHQAVPDTEDDHFNVYLWAEEYVRYELYKDILGKEIDVSGLDAYLTYRPWCGVDYLDRYSTAVSEGRIPGLPNT